MMDFRDTGPGAVPLDMIRRYLVAMGWHVRTSSTVSGSSENSTAHALVGSRTGGSRNFEVFVSESQDLRGIELVVPNSITSSEYASQVSRVIAALSAIEDRAELDVARSIREGAIRVLSEQLAAHRASTEPRTIYVQWADNGNIRKWAWSEFDLAEKLKAETLPVSDTAELLEALKRLTQWEGHHVYCGHAKDDSRPCVCGFNDAYNAACDVIAKAGAA